MSNLEIIRNIKHTWPDSSRASFARLQAFLPLLKRPDPLYPTISSSLLPVQPKYHHQPTVSSIILYSLLRDVSIPQPPPWQGGGVFGHASHACGSKGNWSPL